MPQDSYEIPAKAIQYTIYDNLLLIFNEAGAVYVIDVDATANTPMTGPQFFQMAQPGVSILPWSGAISAFLSRLDQSA